MAALALTVACAAVYSADKRLGARIDRHLSRIGQSIASLATNAFSMAEQSAGYAFVDVSTNETHDFAMPPGAVMADRIAIRGAHSDGFWLQSAIANEFSAEPGASIRPPWVHTDGTVTFGSCAPEIPIASLPLLSAFTNISVFAPLQGSYGFLPASSWSLFATSRIWSATSASGSRIVTWENAMANRDTATPVSFQAEFTQGRDIVFRYGGLSPESQTNMTIGVFRNGAVLTAVLPPFLPVGITGVLLRFIGDLGDGTGDKDGDGLCNWHEIHIGSDPLRADTDGDGLADGVEVGNGTDPCDFDTDGDGLADSLDDAPCIPDANGFGQTEAWIRATFPDADGIIAIGYTNYLQSIANGNGENRQYIFEVTLDGLGGSACALIRVGDQFVVANLPGTYGFPLSSGPEYPFEVNPGCTASFSASRDDASIDCADGGRSGTVAVYPRGISATPQWMHYGESGETHSFSAECTDTASPPSCEWHWSCDSPDVEIASPSAQTTAIEWNWPADDSLVTWDTRTVFLSCKIGHWSKSTSVTLHRGTHLEPETHFAMRLPKAFFATNGADVVISYSTDIPTNAAISVETASGASFLDDAPPWNWTIPPDCTHFCVTNRIKASRPSETADDIALNASIVFGDEEREPLGSYGTTSAVEIDEVTVPSAPGSGLVVLAGTSVNLAATFIPANTELDEAKCDWFIGRRKKDGSYDEWDRIAENVPGTVCSHQFPGGGVYRIMVKMALSGETQETFYKIKARTALDPPASYYDIGGYNHIGVASEAWQLTLRDEALSHLGSTAYAEMAFVGIRHGFCYVTETNPKCNIFVAHIAEDAGLHVPGIHGHNPFLPYPPVANDWATGGVAIPGWQHISTNYPEPGWVVGHPNPTGMGHCGIVDYDGYAIGAGQDEVNRRFWQFLDGTCGYNKITEE